MPAKETRAMGLIADLNELVDRLRDAVANIIRGLRPGGKPAKRPIADVEKDLQRLGGARADAREAVARAMRERDRLLLVNGSDKQIAELDLAADKARLVLERCERAEPLLLAELQGLRTEARQARWSELRLKYDAEARAYAGALRMAVEKQAEMIALGDTARREGFETESNATFTPPARLVSNDALNDYEAALDRQADAQVATAPPAIAAKAIPKAALKLAAVPRSAPPPAVKPPRQRIIEEAGEGRKQYVVVRNGIEVGSRQLAVNDVVALEPAAAEPLLRSGSIDLYRGAAA
jgi:hypothetical protein